MSNSHNTIKEQLEALAEPKFQKFTSSLLPGVENIMGVRLPKLRKIAKQIAKGDWRTYLNEATVDTFEEIMLQGMVIGCCKTDFNETAKYITGFIPKIQNWSVCDSFCSGLKIAIKHKKEMWDFIHIYLKDTKEYNIRFGVVMLLNYYTDQEHISQSLLLLEAIKHDAYYVKMAVAWAISIYYINLPGITMDFLQKNSLDDFTYNKTLQKITESQRVDTETKHRIRNMKRNK